MNKFQRLMATALLLTATLAQAQVGALQGVVQGVPAGTVLAVLKGDAKVADLKVEVLHRGDALGVFLAELLQNDARHPFTAPAPNPRVR